MANKKRGFTLIELLAVIVILGLLMAIAIPSVTKYITQSRKKTVTTTIGNYISALTNQVNDMEYVFTATNTVYAVPIECIALERGGNDPFGKWHQASDAYWAYVLIQYNDATSSYTYGFTFKDSAGYGLYPTTTEKLQESGSQIQTGLNLNRPTGNSTNNITVKSNWTGFDLKDDTNLIVLEATSEGQTGDGKTTCTLCQKGDNYDVVEEEKAIAKEEAIKNTTLMATSQTSTIAFWNYRYQIKTITFEDSINIPVNVSDEHKWDVSATGKGMVMAYITPNAIDSSYYDLYIQGDGQINANPDSSSLFHNFRYVDSIKNIEILNTSRVTNMDSMFDCMGFYSKVLTLNLGNNFDTRNVTSMGGMFRHAGYYSNIFTLDLGDMFDTSNVRNMGGMFQNIGFESKVFKLDLGDKFNTSKVTSMSAMFYYTGHMSTIFTLNLGDKFDTSNVIRMDSMFVNTGKKNEMFKLDCSHWNVDKVTNYSNFNDNVEEKVIAPKWVN